MQTYHYDADFKHSNKSNIVPPQWILNKQVKDTPIQTNLKLYRSGVNDSRPEIVISERENNFKPDNDRDKINKEIVVKIACQTTDCDSSQPWHKTSPTLLSSSGVAINFPLKYKGEETKKVEAIITNAHAVNGCISSSDDGNKILTVLTPERTSFKGRVLAVDKITDLALIEMEDDDGHFNGKSISMKAFDGTGINDIKIPKINTNVEVVGYPLADEYSSTSGRITSVSSQPYAFYGKEGLTYTTDAIVKGGNSGGPVFNSETGEFIAIAFEGIGVGTAFLMPRANASLMIRRLQDMALEKKQTFYDIKPIVMNISTQPLDNEAHRKFYKLHEVESLNHPQKLGVRVTNVPEILNSELKPGDIITNINNHPVKSDENIILDNMPINMRSIELFLHEENKKLNMTIYRMENNKLEEKNIIHVCSEPAEIITRSNCADHDNYVIAGNFVMVNASIPVIQQDLSKNLAPISQMYFMNTGYKKNKDDSLVVLENILPSSSSNYYSGCTNEIVESINGIKINNLRDVTVATSLTDSKQNGFLLIKLKNGIELVEDYSNTSFSAKMRSICYSNNIAKRFNVDFFNDFKCQCGCPSVLDVKDNRVYCQSCNTQHSSFSINGDTVTFDSEKALPSEIPSKLPLKGEFAIGKSPIFSGVSSTAPAAF